MKENILKLKKMRESKGLTQAELAKAIGVSIATIGNVESGNRKLSTNVAIKLADFFNTDVDCWIDTKDDNKAAEEILRIFNTELMSTKEVVLDLIDKGCLTQESLLTELDSKIETLLLQCLKTDILKIIIKQDIENLEK